ncbi:MAG: undecaprenyl-phosphate galactose phosphotransferase WbaP [Terracidiphilus sp.]
MSVAFALAARPSTDHWLRVRVKSKPVLSAVLIVFSDLTSLAIVSGCSVLLRKCLQGNYAIATYLHLWPVIVLFVAAYYAFGTYPGIAATPITEIRKTTAATTSCFLVLGASAFMTKDAPEYSRGVFILAWAGLLVAIPLMRTIIRTWASRYAWWGVPVAVCDGDAGTEICRKLLDNPTSGLRPVAIIARHPRRIEVISSLPVFSPLEARCLPKLGVRHAIIAENDIAHPEVIPFIEDQGRIFPHLLVVPNMEAIGSLNVQTRDICHSLALVVRKDLLRQGPQIAKRIMDVCIASAAGLAVAPIIAVFALLIKLESGGAAFFTHTRIGRAGNRFRMWKLRTMRTDADRLLAAYLRERPDLAFEWQLNHKLKNDPRLTRIGRFLRSTSLDELPQLWNVLKGEMSLVGPRPIVETEIQLYGDFFDLYTQVAPGITGMWQVSGRNDTTYDERVELDAYYVRNWSPLLDCYLLAKTFQAVATRSGAY